MNKNKLKQNKIKSIENYVENYLKLNSIIKNLSIKKNDKIIISSRLMLIIGNVYSNNLHLKININLIAEVIYKHIIETILGKIGDKGTLLIPTYNWSFCKGRVFDYYKTPSSAGDLGNFALKYKNFKRTLNPIYSFAVTGKDKNLLCNMSHESCFGNNSPFAYLIEKNGKNLFIGFDDYREGFNFPYVAEEKIGVDHRYFKYFFGKYKKGKNIKKFKIKMYVRKIQDNEITHVRKEFKNFLIKRKTFKEIKEKNIFFSIIKLKKTFKYMTDDLKNKKKFIVTKKNNV